LLVAASAALGFVLRDVVSRQLSRALAVIGSAGLILGIGILGLTASGHSPFSSLTGGMIAAVGLGAAGLVLPFAIVALASRPAR
jgi:protein-S-isoprenylcysteine O-methyltransferase Ste14